MASTPLITLTTDFGLTGPYVAAMKGALLSVCPDARIVDLCHALPAQDLRAASFFLRSALPYFPEGTIHVVVVDPGVGTERALLCIRAAGQTVLAPDNGCWTGWLRVTGATPRVVRLAEPSFWRASVSSTFHGRDILAPVAGHLALGEDPEELGPVATQWHELDWPKPTRAGSTWRGEVIFVDDFGNLLTNLPSNLLGPGSAVRILGQAAAAVVGTYGQAEPGTLVALGSSSGELEIAVVQGHAARQLGAGVGTVVEVVTS